MPDFDPPYERPRAIPRGESRMEVLRWISKEHQALFVFDEDGDRKHVVIVDASSAHLMVSIADKLNPENRKKFLDMPIAHAGVTAWRMVQRRES